MSLKHFVSPATHFLKFEAISQKNRTRIKKQQPLFDLFCINEINCKTLTKFIAIDKATTSQNEKPTNYANNSKHFKTFSCLH